MTAVATQLGEGFAAKKRDFLGIGLSCLSDDEFVDIVGQVPRVLGSLFRPVQNGLVQFYALAMILGLAVFLIALAAR